MVETGDTINLSIIICSCLNKSSRIHYLNKCVLSFKEVFKNAEIIISFDKYGTEIEGCKCYTHEHGMGHSWNWGIQNAKNDFILQTEDDWDFIWDQPEMMNVKNLHDSFVNNRKVIDKFGGIYRLDNMSNQPWYKAGYTDLQINNYNFCELNKPEPEPKWCADFNMFYYSNRPQLKYKNLHNKIGWFKEDVAPHVVEETMCKQYWESNERVFFSKFNMFGHIGGESSRN